MHAISNLHVSKHVSALHPNIYIVNIFFMSQSTFILKIGDGPNRKFFVTKCYYCGHGLRLELIIIFILNDESSTKI